LLCAFFLLLFVRYILQQSRRKNIKKLHSNKACCQGLGLVSSKNTPINIIKENAMYCRWLNFFNKINHEHYNETSTNCISNRLFKRSFIETQKLLLVFPAKFLRKLRLFQVIKINKKICFDSTSSHSNYLFWRNENTQLSSHLNPAKDPK
jgi:hypothetical protein